MTTPRQSQGAPPFEVIAQEVIATARGAQRYAALPRPPLTAEEKTEADKVAKAQLYCRFCAGVHAMPSTAACPRLASFELDGEGAVKAGTFWPGVKWARGRVEFAEDLHEDDEVQ